MISIVASYVGSPWVKYRIGEVLNVVHKSFGLMAGQTQIITQPFSSASLPICFSLHAIQFNAPQSELLETLLKQTTIGETVILLGNLCTSSTYTMAVPWLR